VFDELTSIVKFKITGGHEMVVSLFL